MSASYETADVHTPATVGSFISDWKSAPSSEKSRRAQKFLTSLDEDDRKNFLTMSRIILSISDAVEILTLAVTYRNNQIFGKNREKNSKFGPLGGGITFAAAEVIFDVISRYNQGKPYLICGDSSVFGGWDRMRETGLIDELDIPEHKAVIEDFIHGDELEIIIS